MRLPGFVQNFLLKSLEGSYRGPAIGWSHWGNSFEIPWGDGFQRGLDMVTTPYGARAIPIAFSCVMLSAKAIALCPASHQVLVAGRWEKSTTSPASRLLRYPNSYQTWAQYILNAVAMMLFEGESLSIVDRDDRYAPTALHLMPARACMPYVDPEEGDVYYSIGANPMRPEATEFLAPQRDVLHLRQYTPRHPLIGETALKAAALALGVNVSLSSNQAAFFKNMSRPSGLLTSDEKFNRQQIQELRAAWDDQSAGINAGKVPIAGSGLKFQPMGITSQDAQLIEAQRMSIEEVARVMGVPLPLVGQPMTGGGTTTESLINFWLATGLGSLIENIESSLERAFNLPATEAIEFDVEALLRTDMKTRLESLAAGVQGGIFKPDEARAKENLPPTEGGDALFMQRQMTPVSLLDELAAAELKSKLNPPAPAPANPPSPADPNAPPKPADAAAAKAIVVDLIKRKSA